MWVTVRAASHPPVWIHRKCELRSLKKMLNGLCWDDDYTIAQWLEHRWLQARVPGSSPGGDSQFFLQTFPVCLFPSNQSILLLLLLLLFTRTCTVQIAAYNVVSWLTQSFSHHHSLHAAETAQLHGFFLLIVLVLPVFAVIDGRFLNLFTLHGLP